MRNKPNFQKSQMFIIAIMTTNYNEKRTMDTWSKQTQTKPIKLPSGKEFRPEGIEHFSDFSIFSQHLKCVLHIFGQRGFEFYHFFSRWVVEFECPGVQGNSVYNWFLHCWFAICQLPGIDKFAAVHIIGHNRMLYVRKVYPYLMCSAGFGGHLQ